VNVEVILASEFAEVLPGLADDCTISVCWTDITARETVVEGESGRHGHAEVVTCARDRDHLGIKLQVPHAAGTYRLKVHATACTRAAYILPLESDDVECVQGPISGIPNFLIACYRHLAFPACYPSSRLAPSSSSSSSSSSSVAQTLWVREEYGTCLGSHTWDSSVVLMRALAREEGAGTLGCEQRRVALDLGAGVGVGGLWLAHCAGFQTCVLTDKDELVPLMQANITLNGPLPTEHQEVRAQALEWSRAEDTDGLLAEREMEGGEAIDLILASDVLYDLQAAAQLSIVLRRLARPQQTPVYLAQRLRADRQDLTALMATQPELWGAFSTELVFTEAGVAVYRMFVCD
jgi:predicted nicotinamide N-methyase